MYTNKSRCFPFVCKLKGKGKTIIVEWIGFASEEIVGYRQRIRWWRGTSLPPTRATPTIFQAFLACDSLTMHTCFPRSENTWRDWSVSCCASYAPCNYPGAMHFNGKEVATPSYKLAADPLALQARMHNLLDMASHELQCTPGWLISFNWMEIELQ